jgi:hyperosmotically inducible protein
MPRGTDSRQRIHLILAEIKPETTHQTDPMKRTILILSSLVALPMWTLAGDDRNNGVATTIIIDRGRDGETLTPGDQPGTPEDRNLTQSIRPAVMKDWSFTLTARNIKIITADGRVTLRGPVATAEEKANSNNLAKAAAVQTPVDNQLEIKAPH